MSEAYNVGFKDGASAGYRLAIEDMKLDKKPQIMKKFEGDYSSLLTRHNALKEAVKSVLEWEYMKLVTIFSSFIYFTHNRFKVFRRI